MDFALSAEQEELCTQVRAYLASNPRPSWRELAELGWTGVSVAEPDGGAGLGFVEEAVIFEELGRALVHTPFWSTVAVVSGLTTWMTHGHGLGGVPTGSWSANVPATGKRPRWARSG